MYSGDEDFGDEITSGIFPDDGDEPDYEDGGLRCPDCEEPNQFGTLCADCSRERDTEGRA